ELVLREFARPGVLLEVLPLRRDLPEAFTIRVADDSDEQSVVERDRETDMCHIARHELAALDPRTKARMVAKRLRRGRDDGVGVRRAGRLALRVGRGHIDIARNGELRLFANALGHALTDGAPHSRQWFPLFL